MTAFKSVRFLMLVGMPFLFACSNVPTRIHEPGVVIESASSEVARLRSVGFWTDRDGLTLRGEVLPALSGQTLPELNRGLRKLAFQAARNAEALWDKGTALVTLYFVVSVLFFILLVGLFLWHLSTAHNDCGEPATDSSRIVDSQPGSR